MKTIKMIADEIGVSKAALQKRIGRGSLYTRLSPYVSMQANTKYIDETGENIIKQSFQEKPFIKPDIDGGICTDIDGNTRKTPPEIQALINQLEIKDKQIADLNLRLAESNAALVSAQQTIQAEQALHAGTIQSRLLTDGKEKEKGGFLSKIFKKKDKNE